MGLPSTSQSHTGHWGGVTGVQKCVSVPLAHYCEQTEELFAEANGHMDLSSRKQSAGLGDSCDSCPSTVGKSSLSA